MKFNYAPGIQQLGEMHMAAQNASAYFERETGPLPTLTCIWDRAKDDRGRALLTLTVRDTVTDQEAQTGYAPDEMSSPTAMFARFHGLVGQVIYPNN